MPESVISAVPPIIELFSLHVGDPRPPVALRCDLPDGYRLALVHNYEEPAFTELMNAVFFGPTGSLRWQDLGFEEDGELRTFRRAALKGRPSLRIAAYFEGEWIGWSFGFADRPDGFYMASSAVLEPHRRRGIYQAMATATVDLARQAGFHFVHSRHLCTNNPILIAKLRMGFVVTGFEVSPDMGSLLTLERPLHPVREQVLMARSGMTLMDSRMAELLTESGA